MSDGFTFFYGAANGSAQKALRQLSEPNVMISYQTMLNEPWVGIDCLFVDSGGYSLMLQEGEHPPAGEYIHHVDRVGADLYALQDYPCEPEILDEYGRTVEDHQERTTEKAVEGLEMADEIGVDAEPVSVVQGWDPADYADHVDQLRDRDALTDTLGIGSVCRRNASRRISDVIHTVDDATPAGTDLHAFGVKKDSLRLPGVVEALSSADSTAYDYRLGNTVMDRWQEVALRFLEFKREIDETVTAADGSQSRLGEVTPHV